jgi:PAS domain-containing protein
VLVLSDIILVLCAVGLTIYVVFFLPPRHPASPAPLASPEPEPLALLFDDGFLHHATQRALAQFAINPGFHVWSDLRDTLLDRFPDLPEAPGSGEFGTMTLTAGDHQSPQRIEISWRGPLCWITLVEKDINPEPYANHEDTHDVAALRRTVQANPHPAWHLNADGQVIWQNAAYSVLQDSISSKVDPLFETPVDHTPWRASLPLDGDNGVTHYAITKQEIDGVTVCYATCIDALVAAEKAKRNFVQTLSKTFAHLPIGLAIFDRNGLLALFNPALVDLSGLSAPFLSRRPTFLSFFDQMRENRQMPEPKNYNSWRQEISKLIRAASDGLYRETWTLEDGRTYAVQGRPHLDGATAFLIEDISAEITLARNFRKEVEMGQTLLDHVDEALVVFSSSGVLTFCNANYRTLWGQNPEGAFADVTIFDAIGVWRAGCHTLPRRDEIERFIMSYEDRDGWSFPIALSDGRPFMCELCSLGAGSKLIRFRAAHRASMIPYTPVHEMAK